MGRRIRYKCISNTSSWSAWFRACLLILAATTLAGCTQPLYYREFWVSSDVEYTESGPSAGFYNCGAFADWPACDVSVESPVPIADSMFRVQFFVVPTDTGLMGKERFIEGFMADSVKVIDANSSDTLATLVLLIRAL